MSEDHLTEVVITPPEPIDTPPEAPTSPVATIKPLTPTKMTNAEKLYAVAKESLGLHMTLNNSVPISVGCAEAVSKVLKDAGVLVPAGGIAGTAELLAWLRTNMAFSEIPAYETGAVIISATGTGNGKIRGHTGICGENGIMSNESQTGLWKEQWDADSWDSYYRRYGGIPTRYFRLIG